LAHMLNTIDISPDAQILHYSNIGNASLF
jgi:hypothetical protein